MMQLMGLNLLTKLRELLRLPRLSGTGSSHTVASSITGVTAVNARNYDTLALDQIPQRAL